MPTEDSLKQSMDKVVKRYSSLFRLPSDREVFLLSALSCVGGGLLSTVALFPSLKGLTYGLLLGIAVFSASLAADYAASTLILKRGTIYNLRRTMALSLFCWAIWLLFLFLGAGLTVSLGLKEWWIRFCLMGFSAAIMLRLVVFSSTSAMSYARFLAASFLQPFLCVVPFLAFWTGIGNSITIRVPAFLLFSVAVALVSTFTFLHFLDNVGKRALGMRSLSLFRAFMLNWVLGLNAPFEHLLEELGEKRDVEVCIVKFASVKPKAVIVVPSVHPGPFKNIGSSLLPSLLKTSLERQLGCVACVPHGLLGHEFDLASQRQNEKVIEQAVVSARSLEVSEARASPFVKVTNGLATACCQVFGKSAIISFTMAPKTIEDLPKEIGLFVRDEAVRRGLSFCAVVNAHNSIDGAAEMQDSLESLKDAAAKCLEKVVSLEQLPFEVGAATVVPKEFALEDGMGPGGITAVVVKCGGQKAAYVVIDGNNMVSGLREEILSALKSMGVNEGEVFTTDTHSVSALILGGHGYHPVGEVMDREKLVSYVREAVGTATSDLEPVRASCSGIEVADITVLGAKQLETLCLLIDKTVQTAKKVIAPIFVAAGLLLMLFLWFV
jgi:putative membrane protein